MGGKALIFARLRGNVKTLEKVVEEDAAGKKVEKTIVRMVQLLEGQPLPTNVADDELARLKRLGHVVEEGTPTGTPVAIEAAMAGKTPAAAGNGKTEGGKTEESLDLAKLADYPDADLALLWEKAKPTVSSILEAVGADAALAAKALSAEKTATKGDGRTTLVAGLEKVIADASAAAAGNGKTEGQ